MFRIWHMLVCFLLFIFSLLPLNTAAFDTNRERVNQTDSLKMVIKGRHHEDSLIMDAHFRLGRIYRLTKPNRGLDHLKAGLDIAEKNQFSSVIGRTLADIGALYWRLSNFNRAYDFFIEAGHVFEKEGDLAGNALVMTSIGAIFSRQGYQEYALEYHLQALDLFQELDSVRLSSSVLNNIGMIYYEQRDFEMAEYYHQKSLEITKKYEDLSGKSYSYNNLGSIRKQTGKYEEAHSYFNKSLKIRQEIGRKLEIANTKINLGTLYFLKEDYDQAIDLLEHCIVLYEEMDNPAGVANVNHILGKVFAALGDFDKSRNYYELSLIIAEQLGLASLVSDNYKSLSELYVKYGDYHLAYDYQKKYLILQDSIYDAEASRRAVELRFVQEREQRENEIQLLRKSHQIIELNYDKQRLFRNFFLLFIFLILVTLVIIYFRFLEYKRTNALLKKQKEEIAVSNRMLKELNLSLFEHQEKVESLNKKLKESEKNLININKTKDKFFSIISHDLRNPFASIVSFSRILKRDIDTLSKEELHELVEDLDTSVIKISNLLDNLLQWSRTQTGKISFKPEKFSLKEVIIENFNLFATSAREKEIDLLDKTEGDVIVYGDINMTDTVLRNLISNALKYSHPGGKVVVSAMEKNGFIELSVSDTGVGVSKQDQLKLFRSDMLHSTYGTKDEKGSGLGLLLCREFISRQGGTLSIKSEVGKGSEFSFTLPRNVT